MYIKPNDTVDCT